jgi:hypothetical protein
MSTVKSLEDLKRIKEQALEKRKLKTTAGTISGHRRNGYMRNRCWRTRYDESYP